MAVCNCKLPPVDRAQINKAVRMSKELMLLLALTICTCGLWLLWLKIHYSRRKQFKCVRNKIDLWAGTEWEFVKLGGSNET